MLIPDNSKKKHILKSLKRTKLNQWLEESDRTDLYIFFREMKLKVEETEKLNPKGEQYSYYTLIIYTQNKKGVWKFKTKKEATLWTLETELAKGNGKQLAQRTTTFADFFEDWLYIVKKMISKKQLFKTMSEHSRSFEIHSEISSCKI